MRSVTKKVPIFPCNIIITNVSKWSDIKNFFPSGVNPDPSERAITAIYGGYIYVAIRGKATHGIIAHESAHIALGILNRIGNKFTDKDDDEVFAYLLEWVYNTIEDAVKSIRKKSQKKVSLPSSDQ